MRDEKGLMGGINFCLVSVESKSDDRVRTESGVELYVDTTWHPEQYVTIRGRIDAVPMGIDTRVLGFENCSGWDGKVGDTCYFHYLTVDDESEIRFGMDVMYSCPINRVFCVVKDGDVRMLSDWEMVEPMGYKMPERVNGIHVPESMRDKEYESIGLCLTGEFKDRVVIFKPFAKFENVIEGKKVFLMKKQMILGTL